ncbi:conserved hypothetical protein [Vibrio nigripulchritudo SOn1]|uniref:Glycosyltransferase n=1 Tax=Vibrio nigripulchritudo SOn1 TaxID=1238450 RepID=A0AAV2VUF2_9VIBR|nr:hypothetical protein [Vibrio nigripulchritudo]CCO48261.1 conserved hypothetical protein [Vibrio nigripulchritudo SOn1]
MKILFIAGLFRKRSCSASIRNVALVNGLAELGVDITVLTVKFPNEVLDPYLISSVNKGVKIIEVSAGLISLYIPSMYSGESFTTFNYSFLRRLVKNIIYFPSVDKRWIKEVNPVDYTGYDLIISSSDTKTSHFVADRIIKNDPTRTRWLQIWGDPWADDIGLNSKLTRLRAYHAEKRLLKKADLIGYVSKPTAQRMSDKNPLLSDKIKYIPRNFFKAVERCSTGVGVLKISYTGVLKGRDITPMLNAMQSYNASSTITIFLDVYGRVDTEQKQLIENCSYAQYHGEVSLKDVFEAFKSSDALLYLGNAAGTSQIPGKLYDYFGTNLPILALVQDMNDDVTKFILKSERCIVFENKVSNISLDKLVKSKGAFSIMEEYSPKSVASSILKMIDSK